MYVRSRRSLDPFIVVQSIIFKMIPYGIIVATVPRGEWLGSSADEGRAKLR